MSLKLPPYPDYRDSGSRFLGAFPSHWRVERAKVFLREMDQRSTAGDEEMLSVSHKTGVTPRREKNVTMFMAESNVGHKLCRPGDVVVNTMWAWMAAAGVSRDYGLVSPSYAVYRPLSNHIFAGRFLDDLLRTPAYRDEYLVRSTGITSSRLRLYPDEFLTIPLAVPPLEEQQLITRYLNHLDETIRRYVGAKQSVLNGLRSRRDVLTQHAVDGANESVRIGAVVDKIERPIDRDPLEVYTPIGVYNRGRGLFHKAPTKGSDLGDSSFFWLADGDLVLSGQFSWEGAIALATREDADCVATIATPCCGQSPRTPSAHISFRTFKRGGVSCCSATTHAVRPAGTGPSTSHRCSKRRSRFLNSTPSGGSRSLLWRSRRSRVRRNNSSSGWWSIGRASSRLSRPAGSAFSTPQPASPTPSTPLNRQTSGLRTARTSTNRMTPETPRKRHDERYERTGA